LSWFCWPEIHWVANCSEYTDFRIFVVAITSASSCCLAQNHTAVWTMAQCCQLSCGGRNHYKSVEVLWLFSAHTEDFCLVWIFRQLHDLPPWGRSLLMHSCAGPSP